MNPMMKRLLLNAPQGIVKRGLVAWYDFTDPAGSQVLTDKSGYSNHGKNGSTSGTDTNDVTFDSAKASFGGDDYIVLPINTSIFAIQIAFYSPSPITSISSNNVLMKIGNAYFVAGGNTTGLLVNEILSLNLSGPFYHGWCDAVAEIPAGWNIITAWFENNQYNFAINDDFKPMTVVGTPQIITSNNVNFGNFNASYNQNGTKQAYGLIYNQPVYKKDILQNVKFIKKDLLRRGIAI